MNVTKQIRLEVVFAYFHLHGSGETQEISNKTRALHWSWTSLHTETQKAFCIFTLQLFIKRKQKFLPFRFWCVCSDLLSVHVRYFCYTWDEASCFHSVFITTRFLFTKVFNFFQMVIFYFSPNVFNTFHNFSWVFVIIVALKVEGTIHQWISRCCYTDLFHISIRRHLLKGFSNFGFTKCNP